MSLPVELRRVILLEPFHEQREVEIGTGPEQKVKVGPHQRERRNSHAVHRPRFFHQRDERVIIVVTTEENALSRPSIADVVHVSPRTLAMFSRHGAIAVAIALPTS